jgi:hypothetical protein
MANASTVIPHQKSTYIRDLDVPYFTNRDLVRVRASYYHLEYMKILDT